MKQEGKNKDVMLVCLCFFYNIHMWPSTVDTQNKCDYARVVGLLVTFLPPPVTL